MIFNIIAIVFRWIIFSDYGEDGWKSLIPIYRDYLLLTIACSSTFFWLYIASAVAMVIMYALGQTLLFVVCCIAMMAFLTIPLFAIFQSTSQMKVRISTIGIFVLEVVLGMGQTLMMAFK